jgi:hypothetical protein
MLVQNSGLTPFVLLKQLESLLGWAMFAALVPPVPNPFASLT